MIREETEVDRLYGIFETAKKHGIDMNLLDHKSLFLSLAQKQI